MAGTGKVHQHGERWRFRWRYEDRVQSVTDPNRHDVESLRLAILKMDGQISDKDPRITTRSLIRGEVRARRVPTFAEAVEEWAEQRAHPRRRAIVRQQVRDYMDGFADRTLDDITVKDLVTWGLALRDVHGRADSTRNAIFGVVSAVFLEAFHSGVIQTNPAAIARERIDVRLGQVTDKFLTVEQYEVLRAALPDPWRLFADVSAFAGLRWGEVAALRRRDVDTGDTPVIRVTRAVSPYRAGGFGPPKADSARTVVIDHGLAEALAVHAATLGPEDPLFPDPAHGGPLCYATFHKRAWKPAMKVARQALGCAPGDPRLKFHALRHSHGSWLLAAGVPILDVSRRLGHRSIRTTADVYGHVLPDGDDRTRTILTGLRPQRTRRLRAV